MSKKKYDLIVSLGMDCGCTTYLRKYDLQQGSYPFDWLTHASFAQRIDVLMDDFAAFLDSANFRLIEKAGDKRNDSHCDYYENVKTGLYFYHDFPAGVPLTESFAAFKDKYERRIRRFYERLEKAERVLFVWFSQNTQTPEDMIINGHRKLEAKLGKPVEILFVEHDGALPPSACVRQEIGPRLVRYKLQTVAYNRHGEIALLGRKKECGRIFKRYALREPLGTKIGRRLRHMVLKPLFALIPDKTLRRALRKRYL